MSHKIFLITILTAGLFLRLVDINNNPPALYGDELTITLDAYSLLKTGQDQLGNLLPLTFQMGAGRPAGYVYGSIPFVAIFGPSELGVRGLSIFSGMGIVLLLYYIGRKLFSPKIGLIASAIIAVSPWDISLSRGGFEAHFALFLVLLAFYLFILAKQKPFLYLISAISFGLSLHTYPTYKITLPLFLILLIWYQNEVKSYLASKRRYYFLISTLILFILAIFAATQTFIGGSEKRFSDINVFSKKDLVEQIEQKINFERGITSLSQSNSKLFHNKIVEYFKVIGENYLQNFSIDFLFIHGDRNPRHNMATLGQLYVAEAILILIGLLTYWQKQKRTILFLILWISLSPIATALVDFPHALRSSFMLPPLIILSALGLSIILNQKRQFLLWIVIITFFIQFIFFIQKLYLLSPNEYSNFWSYSAKVASEIAKQNQDSFDYVILSDRIDSIEYAYPVYAKVDPQMVISQNKNRNTLGNYQFKQFNNIYIGNIPQPQVENFIKSLNGSVLYIGDSSVTNYLESYETIQNKDGLTSLVLRKKL